MSDVPIILRRRPRVRGMLEVRLDRNKAEKWRLNKFKEQGGACCFCGIGVALDPPFTRKRPQATLEHLTPISRGGLHHWENVAVSCWPCNQDKGDMTEEEYREEREIALPESA